jgi:hypothetical protein
MFTIVFSECFENITSMKGTLGVLKKLSMAIYVFFEYSPSLFPNVVANTTCMNRLLLMNVQHIILQKHVGHAFVS